MAKVNVVLNSGKTAEGEKEYISEGFIILKDVKVWNANGFGNKEYARIRIPSTSIEFIVLD